MRVETPGEFSEQSFIGKIEWLAHHMADMGRNSKFDLAQYFPEQVQETQAELAQYAGQVITGGIMYNEYYVADEPRARKTFSVGKLEYHRYSTNDFAGRLQDIQDIRVIGRPLGDYTPQGNILCMEIMPIGNVLQYRLNMFYEVRRRQPFAVEENAGKNIWVPIRPLKPGTLEFIDLQNKLV